LSFISSNCLLLRLKWLKQQKEIETFFISAPQAGQWYLATGLYRYRLLLKLHVV
jgi:hypothetical protein